MTFNPKPTKNKVKCKYKTIYISNEMAEKLQNLANKHNTSFNNIVISIIDDFLKNQKNETKNK